MELLLPLAVIVYFVISGLRKFGVSFKYSDLVAGIAAFVIAFWALLTLADRL